MNKKFLILHGSSDLYGASRSIVRSAVVLKEEGHEVILVLPRSGELETYAQNYQIEVYISRLAVIRRKYLSFIGLFNRLRSLIISLRSLNAVVRQREIDVIYTNTTVVLVGAILALITRKPHIWHVREIFDKPLILKRAITALMKASGSIVLCVSEKVKECWWPGKKNDKVHLLYNGIDLRKYDNLDLNPLDELGIVNGTVVLGMIGRVNLIKGHEYFLDIAEYLIHRYDNLHFVLIGDPFEGYEYLEERIKSRIDRVPLKGKCSYLGYREDIPALLNSIDIFVLPSIMPDSLPTVIIEAMASSKPVVATNLGGAIEMLKPYNHGKLIPINDAEISAEILSDFIESKDYRIEAGLEGKRLAQERFSLAAYKREFLRILETIN